MAKRNFRKLDGILLLDKSLGLSSNKALQEARFLFAAEKAGHTGSLDPLASGMLPICFGEATKVSGFLLDSDKHYLTTARFGYTSSTGDDEGEKQLVHPNPQLTAEKIEAALAQFRGEIQQVPPMYSALKKDGQPLYKLARQGLEIERPARTVQIHELTLQACMADSASLVVHCSKGTYIRSLVEDLGKALGVGAYVTMLRRTWVAPFMAEPMYRLADLHHLAQQDPPALEQILLPLDHALTHFPALNLTAAQAQLIQQGQQLGLELEIGLYRLYEQTATHLKFIGLGEFNGQQLKAKRLLAY